MVIGGETNATLMKQIYAMLVISLLMLIGLNKIAAQTFSFSNYTTGSTSYSTTSAGITMTVTATGSGFTPGYPAYNAGGIGFLATFVDWPNRTTTITYTVNFSKPLLGVRFPLYDIDQNATWDDRVTITGVNSFGTGVATEVYPSITANSYSAVSGANQNILEGTADNPTFTNSPAYIDFNTAISSFTIVYSVGSSSPVNPASQVFGFGTVSAINVILPLTLVDFTASAANNNALLKWQAENQVGFDHFEVERSATATGNFETVAIVATSNQLFGSYTYTDRNVRERMQIAYYRLKMVDQDGTYTYISIVIVRFGASATVNVYPTLLAAGQPINVSISETGSTALNVKLLSIDGRLLSEHKLTTGQAQINTAGLKKGMYLIQVQYNDTPQVFKAMVQ